MYIWDEKKGKYRIEGFDCEDSPYDYRDIAWELAKEKRFRRVKAETSYQYKVGKVLVLVDRHSACACGAYLDRLKDDKDMILALQFVEAIYRE